MKAVTRTAIELVSDARLNAADKGYTDCTVVAMSPAGELVGTNLNAASVVADVHGLLCKGFAPLGTVGLLKHSATDLTLQTTAFREHGGNATVDLHLRRYAQSLLPSRRHLRSIGQWYRG